VLLSRCSWHLASAVMVRRLSEGVSDVTLDIHLFRRISRFDTLGLRVLSSDT
jgi:hypothetical protein